MKGLIKDAVWSHIPVSGLFIQLRALLFACFHKKKQILNKSGVGIQLPLNVPSLVTMTCNMVYNDGYNKQTTYTTG